MNQSFPGMVHSCPYRELLVSNATHYDPTEEEIKIIQMHANGLYIRKSILNNSVQLFDVHYSIISSPQSTLQLS